MEAARHTRVAVLGGSGFLGTHVTAAFARHGYEVRSCSRSTGVDARDQHALTGFLQDFRPAIFVNCANHGGGIAYNAKYPVAIFEDILLTGFNALHCAAGTGVRKFVNIMGNSTYPGTIDLHRESSWWDGPLHPSVMVSSMPRKAHWVQGWAYKQGYGFNSIHLVLPNMYGPGDHLQPERSHALAAMICKIWDAKRSGAKTVEIWGTGKPVREWLYVEDAAEGVVIATERYDDVEILNLGSGTGCSILELAMLIAEILEWDGEFVCNTGRPDGAPCKVSDVERMKEALNWTPPTSLKCGIEKAIRWFLETRNALGSKA
jgi:GDP-L-fucose synthase